MDSKPQVIQGVYGKKDMGNISQFNHEGKAINNKLCEIPENLDEMPNHNYELFSYEKYFQSSKLLRRYDETDPKNF